VQDLGDIQQQQFRAKLDAYKQRLLQLQEIINAKAGQRKSHFLPPCVSLTSCRWPVMATSRTRTTLRPTGLYSAPVLMPGGKGTCYLPYAKSTSSCIFHFTAQALKLGEGNSCDIGYPFLRSPRARRDAPPIKPRSNTRPAARLPTLHDKRLDIHYNCP